MRIYIAGPLQAATPAEQSANIGRALMAATAMLKLGHTPYVPHLTFYWDSFLDGHPDRPSYEDWLAYDFQWLAVCDAILYLGSSPGADRELEQARRLGLNIFFSIDDVPDLTSPLPNVL